MGKRYVNVPSDRVMGQLREIGAAVEGKGGKINETVVGKEVVVELSPPRDSAPTIRVFTSLARGAGAVRGCGEDAVRIVLGWKDAEDKFHPVSKSRRIYRTAPQGPEEERIETFLNRFKEALREAYGQSIKGFPACPKCGGRMKRRQTKDKKRSFFGCLSYPNCRGTRSISGEN